MRFKLEWTTVGGMFLMRTKGRRMLGITLLPAGRQWVAIALESPRKVEGMEEVLEDHAHRSLGPFKTLGVAMQRIEGFARAWEPNRLETCVCPTIGKLKKTGAIKA